MFSNPLRLRPLEEESSCFGVFSGATTIRSLSSAECIRRSCGCDCDRLPAGLVQLTPTASLFVSSASWSSRCVSSSVSSAATVRSSRGGIVWGRNRTESPQSLASGSLSPSEVAWWAPAPPPPRQQSRSVRAPPGTAGRRGGTGRLCQLPAAPGPPATLRW